MLSIANFLVSKFLKISPTGGIQITPNDNGISQDEWTNASTNHYKEWCEFTAAFMTVRELYKQRLLPD